MISRKKKISKRNPKKKVARKRNPEDYNLIFSDNQIKKLSANQLIQHIESVSEHPYYGTYGIDDDPFVHMNTEDRLKYINSLTNRWVWTQD